MTAAGVEVDVEDGFVTIAWPDLATRGGFLKELLDAVGPDNVRKVTRPRVAYVVPEAAARQAGLLETDFVPDDGDDSEPQGYDDGKPDMDWSRKAINDYAVNAGVESPEKMGNKQEVLDAIAAKEAAAPASDETPGDTPQQGDETPGDATP